MQSQPPRVPWFYDEYKHVGVDFGDPAIVARYEAAQRTSHEGSRRDVEEFGIEEGDVVVEFGPGTGVFAVAAAGRGARVIAVDVSAAMLEFAGRAAAAAGVGGRLELTTRGVSELRASRRAGRLRGERVRVSPPAGFLEGGRRWGGYSRC